METRRQVGSQSTIAWNPTGGPNPEGTTLVDIVEVLRQGANLESSTGQHLPIETGLPLYRAGRSAQNPQRAHRCIATG